MPQFSLPPEHFLTPRVPAIIPSKRFRWVIYGLLVLVALESALIAAYYPRVVDVSSALDKVSDRKDYRDFYDDSYAAADKTVDPKIERSYGIRETPTDAQAEDNSELRDIQALVQRYGLERKRVLEVGSGAGQLQDAVEDYTGLDIAATAKRFYHKPFVAASATSLPFRDNEFDAIWSLGVLEHVPKPEQALREMRRVLKNGGILYLSASWQCRPWHADGYSVRPYSDFGLRGKLIKASIPLRDSILFRSLYTFPIRLLRLGAYRFSGKPMPFRYNPLKPNYIHFWETDGDAVNSMDAYEAILWFRSRGDECLNYPGPLSQLLIRRGPVIFRIRKLEARTRAQKLPVTPDRSVSCHQGKPTPVRSSSRTGGRALVVDMGQPIRHYANGHRRSLGDVSGGSGFEASGLSRVRGFSQVVAGHFNPWLTN